jgi:hypothetical protein
VEQGCCTFQPSFITKAIPKKSRMNQTLFPAALLFFFCFILISCKPKARIVADLDKYKMHEGMYVGSSNKISHQWRSYVALRSRFSEDELVELCEHTNPIVRTYAFEALTDKCSAKAYDVLLKHLSDTAWFTCSMGCFIQGCSVTDNMLFAVGYRKKKNTWFTLSEEQYDYLDSALLFRDEIKISSGSGKTDYWSRRYALERLPAKPHFYNRVKEIVNAGIYEALPLLAKYKNPADTTIFTDLLLND